VKRVKFALISPILPPSSSGQAMVLYQLLRPLDPGTYCLISQQDYESIKSQGYTDKLPGKYYKITSVPKKYYRTRFNKGWLSFIGRSVDLFNVCLAFIGIPLCGIQIAHILRQERCDAAVACTADLVYPPAVYLASFLAGTRYYIYVFDYYSYQWKDSLSRAFARIFESTILKGADGIIVPNEYLGNELEHRYDVNTVVIHNSCNMSLESFSEVPWPAKDGEISIVYTGAVYYAHYDAFRNLVRAIEELHRQDISIHIYTASNFEVLKDEGISGPVVYHEHLKRDKAVEIQKNADILYLPLAFDSEISEVIKTSSPGKMGEYLSSNRPILVHAPVDSFVSWYFRKYGCGVVADNDNIASLSRALKSIIDSKDLRTSIVTKAHERAESDFKISYAVDKFVEVIGAASYAD
jgi:glycosyltransferase involved in cell wall biosynthesis